MLDVRTKQELAKLLFCAHFLIIYESGLHVRHLNQGQHFFVIFCSSCFNVIDTGYKSELTSLRLSVCKSQISIQSAPDGGGGSERHVTSGV